MSYRIEFFSRAHRQIVSLPRDVQRRLQLHIDTLHENPRPPGTQKLQGSESTYRLRIGSYRVIYEIHDDMLLVLVIQVGPRRDAYRRL